MKTNTQTVPIVSNLTLIDTSFSIDEMFAKAVRFHKVGDIDSAESLYRNILRQNKEHSDSLHLLGLIFYQKKNYAFALELIESSIKLNPTYPDAYSNLGNVLCELHKFTEALSNYNIALIFKPDLVEALNNRANVFKLLSQFKESLNSYDNALLIFPSYVEALSNRGLILKELKLFNSALDNYDVTLSINPSFPNALVNRANVLKELNRLDSALQYYDYACLANPTFFEAYSNRGVILQELNNYAKAIESLNDALSLNPCHHDTHSNLGVLFHQLQNYELALLYFDNALVINPYFAHALSNKAITLYTLGRLTDALEFQSKAIAISPYFFEAHSNYGVIQHDLKKFNNAQNSYLSSLTINPNYADAKWNLALSLLIQGDLENGLPLYENRWFKKDSPISKKSFSQPILSGREDITNKVVLIYSEQGIGDTIQFIRFLPLLVSLKATVLFEVDHKLISLLKFFLPDSIHLIKNDLSITSFDYHSPLLSLPLVLKTNLFNIPPPLPVLFFDFLKYSHWNSVIGSSGFKIGINWQGNQGKIDLGRSFPVTFFKHISTIKGVRLISLQKGFGTHQLESLPQGLIVETLPNDFDNGPDAFIDTVSILQTLDLVITSDTSIAHVSASLGVRTWVALKFVPDWRWLLDRNDSPWYPSIKLFRQPKINDWETVFNEIQLELLKFLEI